MNDELQELGVSVFERGWLSSNNVLLASAQANTTVLIDTGYSSHAGQTVALVENALGGRRLDRIVNTHLHSDHCGGNHALQDRYNCAIDVPAGEVRKVDAWDEGALTYVATGQRCPRFRRTGSIASGDEIHHDSTSWRALHAPGHDPESLVFYEPELQVLISADALWSNGFGVVFPELVGEPGFDDVERTLSMLSSLRVRWVIPGHGAPFADVEPALERAFKRLRGLRADPAKHARHAVKVLIKFHMLEVQACTVDELNLWLDQAPYVGIAHRIHFPALDIQTMRTSLLQELVDNGALRTDGQLIRNS